jgi:hypothetical protein
MRALMLVAVAAALASCSRPSTVGDNGFADPIAGRVLGEPQSCINTNSAENLHPLDAQTIAYGYGRTIYINRLAAACPAVGELNALIVEPGLPGQYCRGDRIRSLEPGSIIPGPTCNLGDWIPYRRP